MVFAVLSTEAMREHAVDAALTVPSTLLDLLLFLSLMAELLEIHANLVIVQPLKHIPYLLLLVLLNLSCP